MSAPGYTLVVCEKPDAARRVADALSGGSAVSSAADGVTSFRFAKGGEEFVVCSALGHLFGVSDPFRERTVYPVFDVEWYPSDQVDEGKSEVRRRIAAIRRLSGGASKFVNACDFDAEGETIGFNILRYVCGGKEEGALRARFSTLTSEDLLRAFREAKPEAGHGLAAAGRVRHVIDFVWGVNLSRVLSQSAQAPGRPYATVSMGRVQGPTLGFLGRREREIRCFVPVPYWKASGTFANETERFRADHSVARVETRAAADRLKRDCEGKEGIVSSVTKSSVALSPPSAFNVGDLQKEAFRVFGMSPARTLQAAERLYLGALISYPRTGSQKLPPSIGYRSILGRLGKMDEYVDHAREILSGGLRPVQGGKDDPAHPAIYPTGERPRGRLPRLEADVFDLIVRRFLAAFGQKARKDVAAVRISVGANEFVANGSVIAFPGWTRHYGRYYRSAESEAPRVAEGDRLTVVGVDAEGKFDQRPPRYNQASLLQKMEDERIGTKATRADVIATMGKRGYAQGEPMEVTDLGLSVLEIMERHSPAVVTTELTRSIEQELEKIEGGADGGGDLVRETVRSLSGQLAELTMRAGEPGLGLATTAPAGMEALVLGRCPVCGTGELRVVRSKKTKKRFVGCSNYGTGCRASAPLPQRGTVKALGKPCRHCSWPRVVVYGGRFPWRLCVNPTCPSKAGKKREV